MKKSPLAQVKDSFGSKEKLVDALVSLPEGVLDRGEDKDAWKQQLLTAANTKLLKLHTVGSQVSKRFGSKEKLVDALLGLQKRQQGPGLPRQAGDAADRQAVRSLPVGRARHQASPAEHEVGPHAARPRRFAAVGGAAGFRPSGVQAVRA
jgi:hypothetical protein